MPPQGQFSEFDDELQDAPQTYVFAKRTYWWSGKLGCTDGSLQLWIPPNLELRQARLTFLPFDHRADAACVQSYSIQQATCMPHVQFYHGFGSHGTHYITLHTRSHAHTRARTHAHAHAFWKFVFFENCESLIWGGKLPPSNAKFQRRNSYYSMGVGCARRSF